MTLMRYSLAMVHSCIEGFLESKISEAQVSNLQCPAPSCESPIAAKMIKELVPQLYERYDSVALDSALAQASALYDALVGLQWRVSLNNENNERRHFVVASACPPAGVPSQTVET